MTVATLDDVQGSLMRYLEDDEKPWVQALLDRAEALILSRMPDAVNRCRVDYSGSSPLALGLLQGVRAAVLW